MVEDTMSKHTDNIAKAMSRANYAAMVAIGAAGPATGNRCRPQRTKAEKANDPKLQRKRKDWLSDYR